MEATISAVKNNRCQDGITTYNDALDEYVQYPPKFDDEYSLWYRKRQQKIVTKVCQW